MADELATQNELSDLHSLISPAIMLNNHICERHQERTLVQSGNSILPSQPTEWEPWQLLHARLMQ